MSSSDKLDAIRDIHRPDGYVYPTLTADLPIGHHTCVDCYVFTDKDQSATRWHIVPGCVVCFDGDEPVRWPCPTALLAGA